MGQIVPYVKDKTVPDLFFCPRHSSDMSGWITEKQFNDAMAERVISLREPRWTQKTFATLIGIQHETYKKYEQRGRFPAYLLPRIAALTGADLPYLMTGIPEQGRKRA